MEKSLKLFMLTGLVSLVSVTTAQAVPLYYTFEGATSDYDADLYHELMGVAVGDSVSYVFRIDDEVPSLTRPDGSVIEFGHSVTEGAGSSGNTIIDYRFSYYAELVEGTGLVIDENATVYDRFMTFSGHFTYSGPEVPQFHNNPAYSEVRIGGDTNNGSFFTYLYPNVPQSVVSSFDNFSNWAGGSSQRATDNRLTIRDGNGSAHQFHHGLTLTSVSEVSPSTSVPEPSVYLLFGLGLLGIGYKCSGKLFKKA